MVVGPPFDVLWTAVSLAFVAAGLAVLNRGRQARSRGARIAETGTTPVRELRPGTAAVEGTARTNDEGETVEAPMSGTEALAVGVEVQRYHRTDDGGHWTTIHTERDAVPFLVEDATGEVRVDPPAEGRFDFEAEYADGDEAHPAIERLLEARGEDAIDHGRRRYAEGTLDPGEEAYVLGEVREDRGGWGEYAFTVGGGADSGEFLLSDKSAERLRSEGRRRWLLLYALGGTFALVGALFAAVPWVI